MAELNDGWHAADFDEGAPTQMDYLSLYDFRTQVALMNRARNHALRAGDDPAETAETFRERRDTLFATHPESALDAEQKATFRGLAYFPYDPAACIPATVDPRVEPRRHRVQLGGDEMVTLASAGIVRFELQGAAYSLTLYWIDVYGGGLFLPFRDLTAPAETYGGGRYLIDTVKGSEFVDVMREESSPGCSRYNVDLDFNYAYNPSCAYNARWVCPLAPRENHVSVAIRAGEKRFN